MSMTKKILIGAALLGSALAVYAANCPLCG